jgi:hypothetical protein
MLNQIRNPFGNPIQSHALRAGYDITIAEMEERLRDEAGVSPSDLPGPNPA